MSQIDAIEAAEATFGSKEKAREWLHRPTTALDGKAPIEMLGRKEGTAEVLDLLARIDHGLAV